MTRSAWAVFLAMLGACGGEPTNVREVPAGVEIQLPAEPITTGQQVQLTAEVRTADGSVIEDEPVRWESSDSALLSVDGNGLLTTISQYPDCFTTVIGSPYCGATITATAGNARDQEWIPVRPRLEYIRPQNVTIAVGETAPYIQPRAVEDDRVLCSYFPVVRLDTTIARLVTNDEEPPATVILGVAPGTTEMHFSTGERLCLGGQAGFTATVIP